MALCVLEDGWEPSTSSGPGAQNFTRTLPTISGDTGHCHRSGRKACLGSHSCCVVGQGFELADSKVKVLRRPHASSSLSPVICRVLQWGVRRVRGASALCAEPASQCWVRSEGAASLPLRTFPRLACGSLDSLRSARRAWCLPLAVAEPASCTRPHTGSGLEGGQAPQGGRALRQAGFSRGRGAGGPGPGVQGEGVRAAPASSRDLGVGPSREAAQT